MIKKEINIILGERIRETRKQKRLTREELAERIDVSVRFLADVEGGVTGVSLTTLKDLSTCLGVSCDYLLGLNDNFVSGKSDAIARTFKSLPLEQLESLEIIIDEILKISKK